MLLWCAFIFLFFKAVLFFLIKEGVGFVNSAEGRMMETRKSAGGNGGRVCYLTKDSQAVQGYSLIGCGEIKDPCFLSGKT